MRIARGSSTPDDPGRLRLLVRFEPSIFGAVSDFAVRYGMSVNGAVQLLALDGLAAERRGSAMPPWPVLLPAPFRADAMPAAAKCLRPACSCWVTGVICLAHGDRLADALRREVGR